jgi:hypothetical protein
VYIYETGDVDDVFSHAGVHQSTALDTANTMNDTVGWMRMPFRWG